jgi:hypothetical protein
MEWNEHAFVFDVSVGVMSSKQLGVHVRLEVHGIATTTTGFFTSTATRLEKQAFSKPPIATPHLELLGAG